ncbi:MAG TPA: IS4 family transposase [Tepidisphaeraceae bacterium]|jgi:hypothetical protein
MRRMDATAWVVAACADSLRLSQAKTLAVLVTACLSVQRISLANIARQMAGLTKHQIKRCWRFCANERIETADAMRGIIRRILRKRKKKLLISLDWTDIKGFQTLMASAVFKGRSIPLCWSSCNKHVLDGHRSRNSFEEALLLVLRSMIPDSIQVVILADRGFGRTELARFCQHHHFAYVIRIQPKVVIHSGSYRGTLLNYPVYKGICKLLQSVAYRERNSVEQNIVIRWVHGLPERRDECWFLMSNLSAGPAAISRLYGQRMSIEELFRDQKNKRNGWSLRDTRITQADRLDRLLLIMAIAYLLLCGLGLMALKTFSPSHWGSTGKNQCSLFTIARIMLHRIKTSIAAVLRAIIKATEDAVPNWG